MAKLSAARVQFVLNSFREGWVTISFAAPDERYEIDISADEQVDIAHFKGNEVVTTDPGAIDTIIAYVSE